MFSLEILLQTLSVGLLFVLFVTGAYKKSFTTAIYVISLAIALQCYACDKNVLAIAIISLGAIISLVRTMFHHTDDDLVRS